MPRTSPYTIELSPAERAALEAEPPIYITVS